jgi:hypothetical protein
VPVFEITRWVPRPPALVAVFRGPFEGQPSSGPPSTGSNRAAPPPISSSDDDDAFG